MTDGWQMIEEYFTPKEPYRILVVDRRKRTATNLMNDLSQKVKVDHAVTADTALQMLALLPYDLVILQLMLPLFSGLELASRLRRLKPSLPVLPIGQPDMDKEAEAVQKLGYPPPVPPDKDSYEIMLRRCKDCMISEAWQRKIRKLQKELKEKYRYNRMLSLMPEIHEIYVRLSRVSDARVPILITGESGTGKELVARMIHQTCVRANKPFVTINCAAVPEGLLESQFFGHEKGAFTGAVSRATGKFEQAHNGTLFLDEIGEMSPMLQAKLLRVIEHGEFERVGGDETINVDVRLLTATNRDLEMHVNEGKFRADLYYRINVFPIHLPPLRERHDDILILTYLFLKQAVERNRRQVNIISADAIGLLLKYPWPGNVRELENSVERAVLLSDGIELKSNDLPQQLEWLHEQGKLVETAESTPIEDSLQPGIKPLRDVEREAIIIALNQTDWNIALTARELGISRNTLYRKIEEHGLSASKSGTDEREKIEDDEEIKR